MPTSITNLCNVIVTWAGLLHDDVTTKTEVSKKRKQDLINIAEHQLKFYEADTTRHKNTCADTFLPLTTEYAKRLRLMRSSYEFVLNTCTLCGTGGPTTSQKQFTRRKLVVIQ